MTMFQKNAFRICLILVGMYYCYLGLRPYVASILTNRLELWGHLGLTNSFLDICIITLGIGLIYTIAKRHKYQMPFIKATAVFSGIASFAAIFVFALFFTREHTLLDILEYGFELLWSVFALSVAIVVWRNPSIVEAGGLTPS